LFVAVVDEPAAGATSATAKTRVAPNEVTRVRMNDLLYRV